MKEKPERFQMNKPRHFRSGSPEITVDFTIIDLASSGRQSESPEKMIEKQKGTLESPSEFWEKPHKSKRSSLSQFSTSRNELCEPVRLEVDKAPVEGQRAAQRRQEISENTKPTKRWRREKRE
ncbi:hypothetical protein M9H77_36298 [Catharanthus roseus]|uniref:Uncharacterized protein n=1 Tax=Catharanthus roseus TaxID=4058 RepID=A0ACB9ZS83_CATRO|nr:hypothetical protein M9H77_36298 [Catharanthus roseus]